MLEYEVTRFSGAFAQGLLYVDDLDETLQKYWILSVCE